MTYRSVDTGQILIAILAVGYTVFLVTLPPARITVSLSAHTEFLSYTVLRPEYSVFLVRGMDLTSKDLEEHCVELAVTPPRGATVEYRRGGQNYFTISVQAKGAQVVLQASGKPDKRLSGDVVFSSAGCAGPGPPSLPLWGPARFGDALRPPGEDVAIPGAMLDGTVSVFARAHERLIGIPFPRLIYKVNTFEIPPGAVLADAPDTTEDENVAWVGQVRVEGDRAGFMVWASSSVRRVSLRPPGLPASEAESEGLVDLGSYAQYLNDPNIIELQFFAGLVLLLFHNLTIANSIYVSLKQKLPSIDSEELRAGGSQS
jgi:hypothetical protein